MEIDFKTAAKVIPYITSVKKPVMLAGRHGIGKSELVYEFAFLNGYEVVERRASQMTEGDLVGLPVIDGGCTRFNPPDWFKECCDNPRVLFLDEVDRATLEVRQGIFELTDSRKLNGHTLHWDTLIFACINGAHEGASNYQVAEQDPAEFDRWSVLYVDPSVEDWLSWGKDFKTVDKMLLKFIAENPTHLEHRGDFEPGKKYPSRRSWVRFNDALVKGGLLAKEVEPSLIYHLGSAFVGDEAAMAFQDYYKNADFTLSAADVIERGKFVEAEGLDPLKQSSLIDSMLELYGNKQGLSPEQSANLTCFYEILPPELKSTLVTGFGGEVTSLPDRVTAGEQVDYPNWYIKWFGSQMSCGTAINMDFTNLLNGSKLE